MVRVLWYYPKIISRKSIRRHMQPALFRLILQKDKE